MQKARPQKKVTETAQAEFSFELANLTPKTIQAERRLRRIEQFCEMFPNVSADTIGEIVDEMDDDIKAVERLLVEADELEITKIDQPATKYPRIEITRAPRKQWRAIAIPHAWSRVNIAKLRWGAS